jgi:hypothetical protein
VGSSEVARIFDVSVEEVETLLAGYPHSVLVNVRTRAWWAYAGRGNLSADGSGRVWVGRRVFRTAGSIHFRETIGRDAEGGERQQEAGILLHLQPGGGRKMAPQAMSVNGLSRRRSGGGFEGPIESNRYKGRSAGLNAAGLPSAQR